MEGRALLRWLANPSVSGAVKRCCLKHAASAKIQAEVEETEGSHEATTSATAKDNHDYEPAAKKRELPKRLEVMYLHDPKASWTRPYMKQKGRGREQGRRWATGVQCGYCSFRPFLAKKPANNSLVSSLCSPFYAPTSRYPPVGGTEDIDSTLLLWQRTNISRAACYGWKLCTSSRRVFQCAQLVSLQISRCQT